MTYISPTLDHAKCFTEWTSKARLKLQNGFELTIEYYFMTRSIILNYVNFNNAYVNI